MRRRLFGGIRVIIACALIGVCLLYSEKAFADTKEILTGKTASQIVSMMGTGFNIGNTFDATGGNAKKISTLETNWGNPQVTQEFIDSVKALGFDTVRIPITWYRAFDMSAAEKFTIRPEYFARIKEVIDYCYNDDMIVIINVHHEAWINCAGLGDDYEKIGEELKRVWEQIADYYADYDQHLIFEGMNEPRMAGTSQEWNPNKKGNAAVNYLNDIFVNVVRASHKGHNDERALMIPGYAASSSYTGLKAIEIPKVDGVEAENIIVSVHSYSPYNFCLSDAQKTFNPNSSSDTSDIQNVCKNCEKLFLSRGIPVVLGETSATNKDNTEEREKWARYISAQFASYGIPIIIWDNGAKGNSGGECHAHVDRRTGVPAYPSFITALMEGRESVEWGSMVTLSEGGSTEVNEDISFLNSENENKVIIFKDGNGLTSTAQWEFTYIQTDSEPEWFGKDRSFYVIYTGGGEPKMILDSAAKSVWWIQIDPDRIESFKADDGKDLKRAVFTYANVTKKMKENGVTDPADLRYFSILAANDNITTYAVTVDKAVTEEKKQEEKAESEASKKNEAEDKKETAKTEDNNQTDSKQEAVKTENAAEENAKTGALTENTEVTTGGSESKDGVSVKAMILIASGIICALVIVRIVVSTGKKRKTQG